jgi:hypothetical protein
MFQNKYLKYLSKNKLVGGYRCAICLETRSNLRSHDDLTHCESCGLVVCSLCLKRYVLNKCPREEKIVSWVIIPEDEFEEKEFFYIENDSHKPVIKRKKINQPNAYIEQTILEPVGFLEPVVVNPVVVNTVVPVFPLVSSIPVEVSGPVLPFATDIPVEISGPNYFGNIII